MKANKIIMIVAGAIFLLGILFSVIAPSGSGLSVTGTVLNVVGLMSFFGALTSYIMIRKGRSGLLGWAMWLFLSLLGPIIALLLSKKENVAIKKHVPARVPQAAAKPVLATPARKATVHTTQDCLAFHTGAIMSTLGSLHAGDAFILATLCTECGKATWTYIDPVENRNLKDLLSNATRTDTLTESQLRKLVIEMGHRAVASGISSGNVHLKINRLTSQGTVEDVTVAK